MVGKVNVAPRTPPAPLAKRTTPINWGEPVAESSKAVAPRTEATADNATGAHEFRIEKGVSIPRRARRERLYPLAEMEINDSFLVPGDDAKRLQNLVCHSVRYFRRTAAGAGKKFITRRVEGGLRVWRVEDKQ
jgi:hypothetical protein